MLAARHRQIFLPLAIAALCGVMSACSSIPTTWLPDAWSPSPGSPNSWLPSDPSGPAARAAMAVGNPLRTDQDRRMDPSRRPWEFVPLTQVKPGMQVLDVAAGGGYTAQLLAVAVGPSGKVWAQAPKPGATLTRRLADKPQPNLVIVERPFEDPVPEGVSMLDLVTIVLNYHDISYLPVDRTKMNARLFAALKPGGRLVIIDHAARSGTGIADGKTLHRIEKDFVINEVQQAGFALDADAAYLRNADDARDQSSNDVKVPSDKFALRFVKPK